MLTILVDSRQPWFQYIWEEFVRIMGAEFPWRILEGAEIVNPALSQEPTIEYRVTQQHAGSYFIPSRQEYETDDWQWIDQDLPVFGRTISEDGRFDLFYNAFVHLSRIEEWKSEQDGRAVYSYSRRHPRKEGRPWEIPVVNLLFQRLAAEIRRRWPELRFADPSNPVFEFSHDIDYLCKTPQLRIKQSVFLIRNALKCLSEGKVKKFRELLLRTATFALCSSDYWHFEDWQTLEQQFGIRSVFYVYAAPPETRGNWLIDPSYRIEEEPRLRAKLRELWEEGFEVGLHGSYWSALNLNQLEKEKQTLEEAIGRPVKKVRQHWLRYRENVTPYLHERLFEFDSTLGWNDRIGFRSGCASRYRPYDHRNQRPFSFFETPMIVMDSHIFDYGSGREKEVLSDIKAMLSGLSPFPNVHISLNWHQRSCNPDYGWNGAYMEILQHVSKS